MSELFRICFKVLDKAFEPLESLRKFTDSTPNFVGNPRHISRNGNGRLNPGSSNHHESDFIILYLFLSQQDFSANKEREDKFIFFK